MELNDKDFCTALGADWELSKIYAKLNGTKFCFNETQFEKVKNLAEYLQKLVDEFGGEIQPIEFNPYEIHMSISATLNLFSINGVEEVKKLVNALDGVSAFGIDALTDGRVCVDATIPNVFEEINN